MLALSEVTGYLLNRGLIQAADVLDGRLTIVDVSSRNQNCAVSVFGRGGLFIKQPHLNATSPGGSPELGSETPARSGPSPAHEAAVYELLRSLPEPRVGVAIQSLLPTWHEYDLELGLLVLELIEGAQDLTFHHIRTGRFSSSLARRLGAALADLHHNGVEPARRGSQQFHGRLPWVLGLDCPGIDLWCEASAAGLQLVQILQATPQMRGVLAQMRTEWRVDGFVHHDIKWDNCLVVPSRGSRRDPRLVLVDWEFADLGDACWDVGCVLGNYLSHWLGSVPVTGSEPPDRYLDLARYPIASMQPAMCAFWLAYVRARKWDRVTADEALLRCVRYAGARLLQSAYERTVPMARLDGNGICLLQLALNVMTRPREAAHHLMGLTSEGVGR